MLRPKRSRLAACAAAGAVLLALVPVPASGAPDPRPAASPSHSGKDFDIREAARARSAGQAGLSAAATNPELDRIRAELGPQALVDIDELTGTPRVLARTDGFLTGPSTAPAQEIALRYLRERESVVGLNAADLAQLVLRKDYVDVEGTHHLSFVQQAGGIPLFGNGVKAHVSNDGRLIQLDGSPVRGVPATLGLAALAAPHEKSKPVGFFTGDAVRRAWSTVVSPKPDVMYLEVVDAQNGGLLYRKNLVKHAAHDADGLVWGAVPGKQHPVDLDARGWLPADAATLDGNVAHVASDLNRNALIDPGEEIGRNADGTFRYPFTDFTSQVGAPCTAKHPCSWDPSKPGSWQVNRGQNAVQVLSYLGTFHDHLAAAPIGFTRAAGNFEKIDGDAVQAHTMLGAATDDPPLNNAFMATPPDGEPPLMGMYLTHDPNPNAPLIPGNTGDSAAVVMHEYTHGLAGRLVVDASGVDTLDTEQSGAMGEAWSDWYAFDYLVEKKLWKDTPAPGDLVLAGELSLGAKAFRTQPLDCPVGTTSARCAGSPGVGAGGYTYGDYARIIGVSQPHTDGEIWGQTLWDLRAALGVRLTRSLVTRAMELSPASPSFLDMRNSILRADTVVNRGRAHQRIWQVFAKRGMGFFAGSITGDDIRPAEDFSTPPPAGTPTGLVSGVVTDVETGAPIAGARVRIAGHDSGFAGGRPAVTDQAGRYTISGVTPGTYPKVYAFIPGRDVVSRSLSVRSGDNPTDWALRRNWVSSDLGTKIVAFNGEDFTQVGCGPGDLLVQTPTGGKGWSTDRKVNPDNSDQPRFVTIDLGRAIDVTAVEIDPSGTCGDEPSSAAKEVTVETSADGQAWASAGRAAYTPKELGVLNPVPLAPGSTAKVRFLRLTLLSNQLSFYPGEQCGDPATSATGCTYSDIGGLAVRGSAS